MAIRTTDAAVRLIIDVDPTITDISSFIASASLIVDEELDLTTIGHTDVRLELIERYLSAHYIALTDPRIDSEKAGPVSAKYQFRIGLGLKGSVYGQQAIAFDTSGTLANMDEGKKVKTATFSAVKQDLWEDTTDY